MTWLKVYSDTNGSAPEIDTKNAAEITNILNNIGVRFEQWDANVVLGVDAAQEEVIAVYKTEIERLQAEKGYKAVDVVRLKPDHPQKAEFRQKFLNEHRHSEDEVRFFVEGDGLFYLHIGGKVYATLCERGDLIGVPDNTPHWFDMGENPMFCAIRLFTNPEGWVANFTGESIAGRFPTYEQFKLAKSVKAA
jgi:1,2-dihydroxy-3-keto-5-methylthiopentene dioxygenase